ncbi:MAG: ABC transporter substrate-binding protein [Dehalococcoidia bacterium]
MRELQPWSRLPRVDRRRFLAGSTSAVAGASALALVGCGDDDDDDSSASPTQAGQTTTAEPTKTPDTAKPKTGGTWKRGAGNNIALGSLPFQEAGTLSGGGNAAAAPPGLVWGQLIRMAKDKFEWEPDHAKEWEIAKDGKSVKFVIRDDIKFHSGRAFTTDDIAFGLEKLKDDKWKSAATASLNPVESYTIIDKYTMEWQLGPKPTLLAFMSLFRMVDKDTYDQIPSGKLVGTGAFKWIDFNPVSGAKLEAYDDYHLGRPYLDKIEYTIFADATALAIALETGVITDSALSSEEATRFYDNKDFNTVKLPANGGGPYITVRTDLEPLQDKRVRQAIGYMIDRERYQKEDLIGRFDEIGRLHFDSKSPAYDAELDKHVYDLKKAKDLLKEAGFANGLPTPVKLNTLPVRAYSTAVAQLLQQDGKEVGIDFQFEPLEYAAMLDRFYQGKLDNLWVGFGDSGSSLGPEAVVFTSATLGNDRIHHYSDPEWIAARDGILAGKADYARFNKAYLDGAFQFPLSRSVGVNFESPAIHISRDFTGGINYHEVWLDA